MLMQKVVFSFCFNLNLETFFLKIILLKQKTGTKIQKRSDINYEDYIWHCYMKRQNSVFLFLAKFPKGLEEILIFDRGIEIQKLVT